MPFVSKSQHRWMRSQEPEMAERWSMHTKDFKSLPERVEDRQKKGFFMDTIEMLGKRASAEIADILRAGLVSGGTGGMLGGMAGAPLGAVAGAVRGNVSEGIGRGAVRGGITGAGAGLGSLAGGLLTDGTNHQDLGSLAGAGIGGLAGYLGSGKLVGKPAGAAKEDESQKQGSDIASRAVVHSYVEKLASAMESSTDLVYHMAASVRMPVIDFVKLAYADQDEFVKFVKVSSLIANGQANRGLLTKMARLIKRGSLLEKLAVAGKAMQALKGNAAKGALAGGAIVGAGAVGYNAMKGKAPQPSTPSPQPEAAPTQSQPQQPSPQSSPDASQPQQQAPAGQQQGSGQTSNAMKMLIAGGALGAGGLGLGALMRARKKKQQPQQPKMAAAQPSSGFMGSDPVLGLTGGMSAPFAGKTGNRVEALGRGVGLGGGIASGAGLGALLMSMVSRGRLGMGASALSRGAAKGIGGVGGYRAAQGIMGDPSWAAKKAEDLEFVKDVMRTAIFKKASDIVRRESAGILCKHLDIVASKMTLEKSAAVRTVQHEISTGKTLSQAIKLAYPYIPGEQRGILGSKLVSAAWKWHQKRAGFGKKRANVASKPADGKIPVTESRTYNGKVDGGMKFMQN